jgi:hypothetical protein
MPLVIYFPLFIVVLRVLDLGCSYIDILASPQFIVPFLVAKITCTSLW